ncbi:MAG: 3-deoxy-7-phosphoheptulonate synthase class II [Pirellulaceae bacterium]|nr:3-deoxy-7-phosphoheptulonate synthase class II [Pirellulaceae bacterium]
MSTVAWTPDSWKSKAARQQPHYEDRTELRDVLAQLARLPPLVTSWEIVKLREQIALAQQGEAWVLQGGDCAESFADCEAEAIASKLKVLLQMSLVLIFGSRQSVVRIGRIAGQYAKPRSSDTETRQALTLPSYRGDLINRNEFSPESRRNDPQQLLRGYERSALTLNFIRALSEGGFADLHHPEYWKLTFVSERSEHQRYRQLCQSLGQALEFIESITNRPVPELRRVDFFTSHEALHLEYERALIRPSVRDGNWYNMSTHMPWIGERTRDINEAHIELLRGLQNPLGIKIGPSITSEQVVDLVRYVNPDNMPGRVTLIHRLGKDRIEAALPQLVDAVNRAGLRVLWVCDPMHGNTVSASTGQKTRRFDDVLAELRSAFAVHRSLGSWLGGTHLELTGENVTECVGGTSGLSEKDLDTAYNTTCDPRLNYDQAMEIAFALADELQRK